VETPYPRIIFQKLLLSKGIECANFNCGGFLNYLAQGLKFPATPVGKGDEDFALGGLVDDLMLEYINIPGGKLVVPLGHDGNLRPSHSHTSTTSGSLWQLQLICHQANGSKI
jgi:hypothetical protein